jgi:hypothetical protein
MTLLNFTPRNTFHKNGTQWIGKIVNKMIGETNYEFIRVEKRIAYARYYYSKQSILLKLSTQYPNIATFFSLLNKHDTSSGFPARRQYERHSDFAVYNLNHEGWFQLYFTAAAAIVLLWNWWMLAYYYDVRG